MGIKFIGQAPFIRVAPLAFAKMQELIRQATMEVGWLGEVSFDPLLNLYHVSDIHIFKQEVHETTCEIDESALSDFGNEILKHKDGVERWNRVKMWGHSHVTMGVSPSGQDDKQMEEFVDNPFFLRVIGNKQGAYRYDLYDFDRGILFEDTAWELDMSDYNTEEFIKKEMKKVKKMKTKTATKTYGGTWAGGNYYADDGEDYQYGIGKTKITPGEKQNAKTDPLTCVAVKGFECLIDKCTEMQDIADVCQANEDAFWWEFGTIFQEPADVWDFYGEMFGYSDEELEQMETIQDLVMLVGLEGLNDWEETLLWQIFKMVFKKEAK